jgi:hypothetical protein
LIIKLEAAGRLRRVRDSGGRSVGVRAAVRHKAKPESFGLVFGVVGLGIAMVNLDSPAG